MTCSTPPTPPAPAPFGLRRRTVLSRSMLGVTAALALSGGSLSCSTTPADLDGGEHVDPDLALLDRVTQATRAVLDRVEERALVVSGAGKQRLSETATCLRAHLQHFAPDEEPRTPPTAPSTPATPSSPDTSATLRAALEAHTTVLTDAAGQAESGAFARLLAVSAAGLSQHLGRSTKTEEGERP